MSNRLLTFISVRQLWFVLAAVVIAQALMLGIFFSTGTDDHKKMVFDESVALGKCRAEVINLVKPDKIDIDLLGQVSNFCYVQVRGENLLGDFNIRRSNYIRQQFQGLVFMWMVVAITLSGVLLASIQLAAAYKLASAGKADFNQASEITLEEKRISLKSSVTGLLILTVSFAFFIVYVIWVYPLTEGTNINPETSSQPAAPQVTLGTGQLVSPQDAPPGSGTPSTSPAPGTQ